MTTDRSTAFGQKEALGTDGGLAEFPTNIAEPDYDEGLVREHGWACGERGARKQEVPGLPGGPRTWNAC